MTGRGREIGDVTIRRRVGILCVPETKWKENCSRQLGSGYKLIYTGENTKGNGVGVVLIAVLEEIVVKVERHSDRIINVQVVIEKRVWSIISTYAPQAGRQQEEKDDFLEKLEGVIRTIPTNEMIVVGGDFNAHLGERSPEYLTEIDQNLQHPIRFFKGQRNNGCSICTETTAGEDVCGILGSEESV